MKEIIDSKINEWDMAENITFPPLVGIENDKIFVSKSLSEWQGRKIFDEHKNLMGFSIKLMKGPSLKYKIEERENVLEISVAIDDDILHDLTHIEEMDLTKIFEGIT